MQSYLYNKRHIGRIVQNYCPNILLDKILHKFKLFIDTTRHTNSLLSANDCKQSLEIKLINETPTSSLIFVGILLIRRQICLAHNISFSFVDVNC